ncbi:MAG: hypothetical protein Tsb0021_12730 [Chlamydiales bacterium]
MTSVISINVDGIGVVPVQAEVTSPAVLSAYAAALEPIITVFNNEGDGTPEEFTRLLQGAEALRQLAANGITDGTRQSFITLEMARNINAILASLETAGITEEFAPFGRSVDQWKTLGDIGLRQVLQEAVRSVTSNRSLQSVIQLEYIRAGNDQIFNNLSTLQQALSLTQDALQALETLQNIKNQLVPENRLTQPGVQSIINLWEAGNPPFPRFDTVTSFTDAFTTNLDPIFNTQIDPELSDQFADPAQAGRIRQDFESALEQIEEIIRRFDQINGTTAADPDRATTLAGRLETILNDINSVPDVTDWIIDGYNQENNPAAGNFQRRLTEAITTGQSVNDQQRQELRQQLFVFEEFYRSASAVIIAINQIITRMASNISR